MGDHQVVRLFLVVKQCVSGIYVHHGLNHYVVQMVLILIRSKTIFNLGKNVVQLNTSHAPLGSLNSVGGVATEINSVNYVSPRSWLTCSHFFFGWFLIVDIGGMQVVQERLQQVLKKVLTVKQKLYYHYVQSTNFKYLFNKKWNFFPFFIKMHFIFMNLYYVNICTNSYSINY